MPTIPVVHYGLGPIGIEIAKLAARRGHLRSIGAVEIDDDLVGKPLKTVTGATEHDHVSITPTLPTRVSDADRPVLLHCTGSSLERVLPQLLDAITSGYCIVSTCEELSYPWNANPELANRLDTEAKAHKVTVVGTGVNPGFAMDLLPVVLTAASQSVERITVHRVQDAAQRRGPLQRKVGAGLTRKEFDVQAAAGTVRHVGLQESVWAIAAAIGWRLVEVTESLEPIPARRELETASRPVPEGAVAGVRQTANGFDDSGQRIALTLEMAVGLEDARDEISIAGTPDVHMIIPGGLHGDLATAAVVANTVHQVVQAPAGLKAMADLSPPRATHPAVRDSQPTR